MRPARHPLDEALRIRRCHRAWLAAQLALSLAPLFSLVNRVQPMFTDGYGRDAIPGLLPDALARHYGAAQVLCVLLLGASEILRRRYHARHRDVIDL